MKLEQMLPAIVPFVRTIGISVDKIRPGHCTATLPSVPAVHNHLGTAHAGAVYTLGETASGGVVLSIFADQMPGIFIALKTGTATHAKAREGDVLATARLAEGAEPAAIRAQYDETGKVDFDVVVTLSVDGTVTGENTYTWAARAPRG